MSSSPLPIKSLHHVARVTKRPDESRAFYRDVLGFREIERPNFDFRGAWLFNYGVQIHLIEHPRHGNEPQRRKDAKNGTTELVVLALCVFAPLR